MRHGHHRHPRRRGGSLQRQLFYGFGVAIAVTGLTMGLVFWIVGGKPKWSRHLAQAETFVAGRFERAWDDPAARDDLARALASEAELGVRVYDVGGALLARHGGDRCRHRREVHIARGDAALGRVTVCFDAYMGPHRPWLTALLVFIPAVMLWGFAGMWARKLARPLRELTAVARDLGDGKLERRARLRHGLRGEVGELTHAVNDMATRIERQVRDQRELLATVSHEMRTPLARLRLLLEIGREGGKRDVFGEMETEVMEMDTLVEDLLAGARLDFGVLVPRPLAAREVAERAVARAQLPGARVELASGADAHGGSLTGDATLLVRALGALLDNARKYGGAEVRLVIGGDERVVRFEVRDTGPGISADDLPHVFEPFFRGGERAPDEASRGVGLGLAIVRRIAEAHGGHTFAENLPEGGARVGFEVPRLRQ